MASISKRFKNVYGAHPLHLLTMVSGFALLGYTLATLKVTELWNQGTWWQSIAVWFVAAVVGHDFRRDAEKLQHALHGRFVDRLVVHGGGDRCHRRGGRRR